MLHCYHRSFVSRNLYQALPNDRARQDRIDDPSGTLRKGRTPTFVALSVRGDSAGHLGRMLILFAKMMLIQQMTRLAVLMGSITLISRMPPFLQS